MSEKLQYAQQHCWDVLEDLLEPLFAPQCKLTLIMHNPDEEDGNLIITSDDLEEVADVVLQAIRKEQE